MEELEVRFVPLVLEGNGRVVVGPDLDVRP